MLRSLPQPHSSTVPPPTSDSLDMQSNSLDYNSSNRDSQPSNHYSQDQQQSSKNRTTDSAATLSSSPVKPDSPTRPYSHVSMSQPTTPKPTGSPTLQPLHSTTQPPSPQGLQPQQEAPLHGTSHPYLVNNSVRRKRRESDYTSDTPTFGMTKYNGNIYATDKSTVLDVHIQSKVDRGFFLADNDWTCYRRNYFQVSSSFSLQSVVVLYDGQELPCFVQDQDMLHEVEQFYMGITARLSDNDKQILLIQHTAKRDKGPQNTPEPKPIRPGGNLSFSSVGANQSIVTFERIQFKSATANNGKRRAAQQYYVIMMELYAKMRYSGKLVPVASTQSQPLVVRGRSPGHYAESNGSSSATVGGPLRRHQYRHHPSSHSYSALTSPPMIPGHTPTFSSHAASSSTMYAPEYPSSYDYPPHSAHNTNNNNSGMHYAYGSVAPNSQHPIHHPSGPYEYHASSPTSPQHQSPVPPPHSYPPVPSRPETSVYDSPYPSSIQQHHQQQHYAPHMHRSESAPSAYDHFKDEEHHQQQQQEHHHQQQEHHHQQQQQQQWARYRMASSPGQLHPGNHSSDHAPYLSRPGPHEQHNNHHAYYSQPQPPMPYYHHPPGYGPSSSIPPPPVDTYQHNYAPNWQQWRPQVAHPVEEYPANGKGNEEEGIKMESKA
ncbi:hypothetical protein BC941DRAFT_495736 [Chlamydoabsidia padenii]|nr:hypothetical protein BC941DRAFT_495736 [Chlamydoabsidia padenii]